MPSDHQALFASAEISLVHVFPLLDATDSPGVDNGLASEALLEPLFASDGRDELERETGAGLGPVDRGKLRLDFSKGGC